MGAREEMVAWSEVAHSLRTGESAFARAHGMEKFPYLAEHPSYAALFNAAMTSFSETQIPAIVAAYSFAEFRSIVDVAGGRGHLLAAVLAKNPDACGVLFEQAGVAGEAAAYLAGTSVHERCTQVSGDFFEAVPKGHDLYLLKHIIHDWNDEQAGIILRRCREAMPENGRVLVIEMVLPDNESSLLGEFLDLEMMVMTPGGRQRTASEYRSLFANNGLQVNRIVPTSTAISLVEGRLP